MSYSNQSIATEKCCIKKLKFLMQHWLVLTAPPKISFKSIVFDALPASFSNAILRQQRQPEPRKPRRHSWRLQVPTEFWPRHARRKREWPDRWQSTEGKIIKMVNALSRNWSAQNMLRMIFSRINLSTVWHCTCPVGLSLTFISFLW